MCEPGAQVDRGHSGRTAPADILSEAIEIGRAFYAGNGIGHGSS
jgi:hypothetical protein